MSRSYRAPWVVAGYGSSYKMWAKRRANRAIRRAQDVPDGKGYRKFFDSWNITDWKYQWFPTYWSNIFQRWMEVTPEWKVRRK